MSGLARVGGMPTNALKSPAAARAACARWDGVGLGQRQHAVRNVISATVTITTSRGDPTRASSPAERGGG